MDWRVGNLSSPASGEGRGAGGEVQAPVAGDVVNHAYLMKPPIKIQKGGFGELLGW